MSDELKAAAESVSWIEHSRHTSVQWDLDAFQEFYERDIDALLPLAKLHLADLAARETEERERALPVDPEWLQSIGFIESVGELVIESVWHQVTVDTGKVKLFNMQTMQGVTIGWAVSTTRGMMLDFLAGLKITTKGGAA